MVSARIGLRIALSPVQLSCLNMLRTLNGSAVGGTCYRRRNEDIAASFRNRDNSRRENDFSGVKSLFKFLNPLRE
jgi:hypothetical protein